jgi:predicted N-acetyltransferase YhbS
LIIRTVRKHEWEEFMRFLERSYGHPRDFFTHILPELYKTDDDALSCLFVLESDGKIASHVGLFPLELSCFGVDIMAGGIGGVATLPEYRGKGYMSRLMDYVAELMKERGWPLSILWGDRQRYYPLGWDTAGLKYSLTITRRALDRAKVVASDVEEVSAEEAILTMKRLHQILPLRIKRRQFLPTIRKSFLRKWLSEDGYVISSGNGYQTPNILEVVSPRGRERELIMGVMGKCFQDSATIDINAFDGERLGRLFEVTSHWTQVPEGQFRVIDLAGLLEPFSDFLSKRSKALRDSDLAIGLRFRERIDVATIAIQNGTVDSRRGRSTGNYVELDERDGVRFLLGGPSSNLGNEVTISPLLPIPIHISQIDHV